MVKADLQKLGWSEAELKRRRKGDPGKPKVALRLRRETTMTLGDVDQDLLSALALLAGARKATEAIVNDTKNRPLSSSPRTRSS
jgi:hypothetical protein